VEHQPIVDEMRSLGCAIDVWKFVTGQAVPAGMIEEFGLRSVEILQVKNRATQYFCEKFAFRKDIEVEVSESRYRLAQYHVHIVIGYVSVLQIEPVSI